MARDFDPARPGVLLSVDEMYRADAAAIAAGVAGETLMENAGAAVVAEIVRRWWPCRVAVLCGPGNNGGDGFVVARLLADAGWHVTLALAGGVEALKGDAATMAGRWTGEVEALAPEVIEGCDLVVDGLFGAGLAREVEGDFAAMVEAVNLSGVPVCAIDVPSGVHGDSGQVLGSAVRADLTVTFFRLKPGHLLLPGRQLAGDVALGDIGTPPRVLDDIAPRQHENSPQLWLERFPWPRLEGHKYSRGHAVAVSGGPATTGATRLAARAALRVGAGLVTVACPPGALLVNAGQLTAVMTHAFVGAAGLAEMLADQRKNAVLLGPGNGVTPETRDNVLAALAADNACVLDADALTVFADAPEQLFETVDERSLLTPHDGEFARLFPDLAEDEAIGKLERTRAGARRCGAVVLLKGADTVIAHPDGRAAINANAPADLATAGAGDVLSGLALGLVAQGMPPFEAACAAAWLHGEAATEVGPGLIAEDLSEALPAVLVRLKQSSSATIGS
jgi:NAD(P)H-hydrate epimerase